MHDPCQPGDFIVTKVPRGFLIGQTVEPVGLGPWWKFIALVRKRDDAIRRVHVLAQHAGVHAWFHATAEDEYVSIDDHNVDDISVGSNRIDDQDLPSVNTGQLPAS